MDYKYNRRNKESIEEYARKLLNKSLNNLNESIEEADFNEVGVELKVCPLRNISKKTNSDSMRETMGYSAKE
jgi:DNA mismatch repair protein MutH